MITNFYHILYCQSKQRKVNKLTPYFKSIYKLGVQVTNIKYEACKI